MSQEPGIEKSAVGADPGPQSRNPDHRLSEPTFDVLNIDDDPVLLEQSYALRYEVYCLERAFLPAADYPSGLEIDEFDDHSRHFGALDADGVLAGTARIVEFGANGLPLFRYCTVFDEYELRRPEHNVVEISRMIVSRRFRRRRGDVLPGPPVGADRRTQKRRERRRGKEMIVCIIDALYRACLRLGVTHCLAGMEYPQQRLLSSYGFHFHQIGPDLEYFGRVAPFMLDLRRFRPGQHATFGEP